MNEKRFVLDKLEKGNAILSVKITDSVSDDDYFIMTKEAYEDDIDEIVDCLNEQQATINELQAKLREKEEDEQLYANEIVKLNKEAKEVLDFKSLGGDY